MSLVAKSNEMSIIIKDQDPQQILYIYFQAFTNYKHHVLQLFFKLFVCSFVQSFYLSSSLFHQIYLLIIISMTLYFGSAYLVTSAFFFFYPTLLHTPKTHSNQILSQCLSNGKILKISHRGCPRYGTQNTMEAFRKVYNISDMLQMDVCQTADGVIVVHHDKDLKRSCGVDRLVKDFKFSQLPNYQNKIKLDFAVNREMTSNNEKIPKLESVFQVFQGVPMDIQLKTPTQSAMKQFVRLIRAYNRQDHTIIGIRDPKGSQLLIPYMNQKQKEFNPILGFLPDRSVYLLLLSYILGLAPFLKLQYCSLQIPVYSQQFQEWCVERAKINKRSELLTKIGCRMIKFINWVSKPLIWHLKKRGILTFGWVCNTQEAIERALDMGVQGIMSDEPYLLSQKIQNWTKKQR